MFFCWVCFPDVPQDPSLRVHLPGDHGEAVLSQRVHGGGVGGPHALQPPGAALQRHRAVSVPPTWGPSCEDRWQLGWDSSGTAWRIRITSTVCPVWFCFWVVITLLGSLTSPAIEFSGETVFCAGAGW